MLRLNQTDRGLHPGSTQAPNQAGRGVIEIRESQKMRGTGIHGYPVAILCPCWCNYFGSLCLVFGESSAVLMDQVDELPGSH